MKTNTYIMSLLAATLLSACGKNDKSTTNEPEKKTELTQPGKAKDGIKKMSNTSSKDEQEKPAPSTSDTTSSGIRETQNQPTVDTQPLASTTTVLKPITKEPALLFYKAATPEEKVARVKYFNDAAAEFLKQRQEIRDLIAAREAAIQAGKKDEAERIGTTLVQKSEFLQDRFTLERNRLVASNAWSFIPKSSCRKQMGIEFVPSSSLSDQKLYRLQKCEDIAAQKDTLARQRQDEVYATYQLTAVVFATGVNELVFADEDFINELQVDWADAMLGYNSVRRQ